MQSTNIDQRPRLFPHPSFVPLQTNGCFFHDKMIAIGFKKSNTNLNVLTFGIFILFTGKVMTPFLAGHLRCNLVPFSHGIFSLYGNVQHCLFFAGVTHLHLFQGEKGSRTCK